MSSVVLGGVLPLAKRHVGRRLYNARATMLRMLEVTIDVRNGYVNVLGYFVSLGRTKGSTLPAKHDGALSDRELRMANHAVTFDAKAFREPERAAEPIDGLADILVDQDWNNSRCWC